MVRDVPAEEEGGRDQPQAYRMGAGGRRASETQTVDGAE